MTYEELFAQHGYKRLCDVAQKVGMKKYHLSNIWYGRDHLGARLAKRIAEATGVPLGDLLYATPLEPPGKQGWPKGKSRKKPPAEPTP